MSDVSALANKSYRLWHDVLGWFRGKTAYTLQADAKGLLGEMERVGNGIRGAAPDAPSLVKDLENLVAVGAAVAASRGADLPALALAGETLMQTVKDLERAYADYCSAAVLVAVVPSVTPATPQGS